MAWNGIIRPALGNTNTNTIIDHFLTNASHGSIGGTPGYNDGGNLTYGERVNLFYNYSVDRANSILSDEVVRQALRIQGWEVRFIGKEEYGFPTYNPTAITNFWNILVNQI